MSLTDKIAVVALLLNALALFYNATQIRLAKNVARGQFLLQLDQMFLQHDEVHTRLLETGWPDGRQGPNTGKEWIAVEKYMGLFERIQVLIDDGIVDLKTINHLYGFRVFSIVQNPIIFQEKLVNRKDHWQEFIRLHAALELIPENYQKKIHKYDKPNVA